MAIGHIIILVGHNEGVEKEKKKRVWNSDAWGGECFYEAKMPRCPATMETWLCCNTYANPGPKMENNSLP